MSLQALNEIEVKCRTNERDRIANTNSMSWPMILDSNILETPSLHLILLRLFHLRQPKKHHHTLTLMPSACHLATSCRIILPSF